MISVKNVMRVAKSIPIERAIPMVTQAITASRNKQTTNSYVYYDSAPQNLSSCEQIIASEITEYKELLAFTVEILRDDERTQMIEHVERLEIIQYLIKEVLSRSPMPEGLSLGSHTIEETSDGRYVLRLENPAISFKGGTPEIATKLAKLWKYRVNH